MPARVNLENPGPPLTVEDLITFEREIGGELPKDYKRFLLAHNGGLVEPWVGFRWEGAIQTLGAFRPLFPIPDRGLRIVRET